MPFLNAFRSFLSVLTQSLIVIYLLTALSLISINRICLLEIVLRKSTVSLTIDRTLSNFLQSKKEDALLHTPAVLPASWGTLSCRFPVLDRIHPSMLSYGYLVYEIYLHSDIKGEFFCRLLLRIKNKENTGTVYICLYRYLQII